jgi:hypothetical protein
MEFLIGALVGTAIVTVMLCLAVVYLRRRYIPGIPNVKLIATVNPEYVSTGECILGFMRLLAKCFWIIEQPTHWKFNVSVHILVGNL